MSDWITWRGGRCPVPGQKVLVRLRGEIIADSVAYSDEASYAESFEWDHDGGGGDIIAYRLARPAALAYQPGGSHYRDCKIQPVEFIEANGLGFLEGSIVKRAARHNKPTGKGREDIEKIIHEAQLILELRYGGAAA